MNAGCGRTNQAGAALLMVLLLVASLSMALAGALPLARLEIAGESMEAASVAARARADSGLLLAAALLSADAASNGYDHPGEAWSAFFVSDAQRNRIMAEGQVKDARIAALFADGRLTGTVTDESGKIPINALAGSGASTYGRILRNLLMGPTFNLSQAAAVRLIVDIKDWLDADTQAGTSDFLAEGGPGGQDGQGGQTGLGGQVGVEAPYYASLGQDHLPPNTPLLSLGELLRVRGMTQALYDGTGGRPGLKDLLTPYGTGSEGVNVNTAPEAVLAALAWGAGESVALAFARDVVDFRSQKGNEGRLENPEWVRTSLSAYRNLVIVGVSLTSRGTYFQARLTGAEGAARAGCAAWFKRESDGKVTVLARQEW
jgi:type II secretory pathway component PulK